MKFLFLSIFFFTLTSNAFGQNPVRIGIAGLSHSHVLPLLRNLERNDIEIVGVAESDSQLLQRYAGQFALNKNILFETLDEMLDKTKPEGVITFTSIFEHLKVVEACASRGIHVMVEKPLAVNARHAKKMSKLAEKHDILLLTNYETTWYPSTYKGIEMIHKGDLGEVRKIIVYDGHKGPQEIRVNEEFLSWLTDSKMNGGGAVTDFGCYGANLITWLMNGEKPISVYAKLKQFKPDIYSKVDDDATIVLTYKNMEGIIHASWNWPFNRKDMHIYGTTGYIFLDDAVSIRYRLDEKSPESDMKLSISDAPFTDPYEFFASAIIGETIVADSDLSSLSINMTVVKILDAARKSNKSGKEIKLK